MHHSVGVNQCLVDRGLLMEACCPRCHREVESILHMLRDCPYSRSVWNHLGGCVNNSIFFSMSIQEWLFSNATSKIQHNSGPLPWSLVFLFSLWLLWKDRNLCVFNHKIPNPNLNKEIIDRATEFFFCAYNGLVTKRMVTKSIRWEKPRAGWLTLNTDGSAASSSSPAGGGGLVRDENGDWVKGFARRIGSTSSYLAELWALRDGLQLCLQIHAHSVVIEVDAKAIVETFNSPTLPSSCVSPIMDECRHIAKQIPQVRFRHIYREANRCADFLGRLGSSLEIGFSVFISPPMDLFPFLEADANGVYVNRRCPVSLLAV